MEFNYGPKGASICFGDAMTGALRHVSIGICWGDQPGAYIAIADASGSKPLLYFRGFTLRDGALRRAFATAHG